jgi:hypothetical protein
MGIVNEEAVMINPKFYLMILLLCLVSVGLGAYVGRRTWRADPPALGAEPQQTPQEAKVDRDEFLRSATSIARPDLLACRNLDAKFTQPMDANPEELARMLNGVWIGRRTVHGISVEMDTAFFIRMQGTQGSGILIDRNNLGQATFVAPLRAANLPKPARPIMMSFVNCKHQFLDQYIKISDRVPINILATATNARIIANMTFKQAWDRINATNFFKRLGNLPMAKLGDGKRRAILPDGTVAPEPQIEQGLKPGAEYYLPMIVGAYFDMDLAPTTIGQRRGIAMKWNGDYRGAGVNLQEGQVVTGIEEGDFFREGNAFVSTIGGIGGGGVTGARPWTTSECADKNGLNAGASASTPVTLSFERVVIGTP